MASNKKTFGLDEALKHPDHSRPKTRREFISQGFKAGGGMMLGTSIFSLMGSRAHGISDGLLNKYYNPSSCELSNLTGRKIPFICFDLAGGANISGSNVLVGGPGGQLDPLSTAGYQKLGLTPDIAPNDAGDFSDNSLGLLFHSESAMLRGIQERASAAAQAATNGAVIPGRSDNDTGNNPHNPMYGIYQAGLRGQLVQLVGSENTESGGNSMAPSMYINPEIRPTKIDRASDARGLVDVGDLNQLLDNPEDVVAVMEAMKHITDFKLDMSNTLTSQDTQLKERISCEYLRSADTLEKYNDPNVIDPSADPIIVGSSGIFSQAEFDGDREFQKTASVMKLVIDGHAGAGTIEMGGYDYHTGDRRTGEARDLRAGRCIGACIEYAMQKNTPLMLYVFSDGSVASNGMIEMVNGIEKGVWTGDNSSTAASFFLVIDPMGGRPALLDQMPSNPLMHQQIGWMRSDASVETGATPAANSVNLLVETVILNYMALHGEEVSFANAGYFPSQSLGATVDERKRYIAFQPLASVSGGYITPPP
ncbi:general secretion pathway protein GspF [Dasania sp. GY-MA-18]|uniref:General secretion pathway protein GspF n=1 Tax=Dasania phycosphaerae TaxID=2950436 RepID=A0A9J6RKQ2_9GAMM|nr:MULTISPECIES: general secretion pathway protein GspF [Dasania]MCR8922372.1 general secretion pathway protein GspF [Dasania sp. GY-MA-18]MCZ0864800.1 general secretion pathway protein GspF [Dasania phycosphaerae]MCZ0868528.1 general secretion pathway protein GspF [Dasania phycosphaerae]